MSGNVSGQIASSDGHQSTSRDSRARILILDDASLLCDGLKRSLRHAGFEGVTTNNGWDALKLIEKEHFDLVITDIMMPRMSGPEFIERLSQLAPGLPCIAMTGHATKKLILELGAAPNVAAVLVKPLDHQRLITAISSAIAREGTHETKA